MGGNGLVVRVGDGSAVEIVQTNGEKLLGHECLRRLRVPRRLRGSRCGGRDRVRRMFIKGRPCWAHHHAARGQGHTCTTERQGRLQEET